MELNTTLIQNCVDFLEETNVDLRQHCEQIKELMNIARQCMDSKRGLEAAKTLLLSVQAIEDNLPGVDGAKQTLELTLKKIHNAMNGGRTR